MFITLMYKPDWNSRLGYVNAYQFKVGESFRGVIHKWTVDSLISTLGLTISRDIIFTTSQTYNILPVIGDFLYYWIIRKSCDLVTITEIPVSIMWLRKDTKYYRRYILSECGRAYTHGLSILLNNAFLTSGLDMSILYRYTKPSLRHILTHLMREGVRGASMRFDGGYPEKPVKLDEEPFDGRIIIAIEYILKE